MEDQEILKMDRMDTNSLGELLGDGLVDNGKLVDVGGYQVNTSKAKHPGIPSGEEIRRRER